MISADAVKWLQVEATTKCNAWCPGCGRSKGGYELADHLTVEDLSVEKYQNLLNQLPNLETVDFCGTYGDAIAAANIVELVTLTKKYVKKIILRTNGSLRSTSWWAVFADLLKDIDHEVWFCLDGLADTHSIYRQATNFDTIIRNASAFIKQGGTAVWQFIPWAHNEHQFKDCVKLSQELGFERFEVIRGVRPVPEAKDYRTGKTYELKMWSNDTKINHYQKDKTRVSLDSCQHLTQPSIYLNANGNVSVCCYFNTQCSSQDIKELPDIKQELQSHPRSFCLWHCGS